MRQYKIDEVEYMDGSFKYHIYSGMTLLDNTCVTLDEALDRIRRFKGQIVKERRTVYSD